MKLKSKTWILALCLWIGFLVPADANPSANSKVLHLINRLSFGPRPGDVQKVEAMGIEKYIQQQLSPTTIPEPSQLTDRLAQLEYLKLNPIEVVQQFRPQTVGQKPAPDVRKANQQKMQELLQEAVEARLLRATESDRQLQEVMVDFWFNHFNVFANKGLTRLWVGSYEQDAIRPHTLGRFRDLLEATARHPAMLFYLDNWQNTAPNSPGAKGRFQGLNENYARELMELHTLGVDGGYTQQDVVALAKILTGWGFRRYGQSGDRSNAFYFDAKRHDFSDKVFLGHTIKGSGIQEVEQALDILARHPATAHHISYQLAQYFVADHPPKSLVDRLTQRFQSTDGNIRQVLNTLFHSPEFWDSRYYHTKFKTPYQYVVSAFRATATPVSNPRFLQNTLQQLGMPLYRCSTPDGYKNTTEVWLNPDGMTRRLNLAAVLASGRLPAPVTNPTAIVPAHSEVASLAPATRSPSLSNTQTPVNATQLVKALGLHLSAQTQQAIAASPAHLRAALILGSPEFMYR